MVRPRLIVTGTGRCGTTWMARALKQAGVPATHEKVFRWTWKDREWVAECSWLAAAYLPIPGAYVVHLVRHPLDTIASFAERDTFRDEATGGRGNPRNGRWAAKHCPEIAEGRTPLERAALHWVHWNRLAGKHANERIRIEDVDAETVTRIARIVNPGAELTDLPVREGAAHPPVTWADVEHIDGLTALAREYGYL